MYPYNDILLAPVPSLCLWRNTLMGKLSTSVAYTILPREIFNVYPIALIIGVEFIW